MTDIDPDDIKAMRKQGDLSSFLRQQIAAGRTRREPAPAKPPPQPPGRRRPGTWPPGTRPPQPVPPPPAHIVDAALTEHRNWIVADRPEITTRCDCTACTPRSQT
ncbi:hypothetical protein [Streptomyces candidus]|uniref:Uncharacterized protein n=1 Tax=Streptomyces candidus TaxID=67283 RepID=A0A7X0HM97_9ACTN|nr:hypothetical protein [Streptomyces candidus]MBB6440256.1 hypothetical protein [Streptomyces candidus]GHH58153.1 hypothetical protein GCM10018773_66240 [Streptomyces candidus]